MFFYKKQGKRLKQKFLTKEQLLVSVDRLTRFKNPKDKYVRVFSDVILSNVVDCKYKKNDLERMYSSELRLLAENIINNSIRQYYEVEPDFKINEFLKQYENSVFFCDEDTNELMENHINYSAICELIDESSPVNLRWLKTITKYSDLKEIREKNCMKFPVEKVVLVEGLTEELLLPAFSRILNYDFYKKGIQVIPAGGKNQVVKLYYKLAEELKIPIFVLLDKDAEENIRQIMPKLRDFDKVHLISCGEFEDLLPKSLIIKTINNDLKNFAFITEKDLDDEIPEAKNLENIFKEKGLHEFKKAEFAKMVRDNLDADCEITDEIRNIVNEIRVF